MVMINQQNVNTTLYKLQNIEVPKGKRRTYLGMSGTGSKCLRAMQYNFRWCMPSGGIGARLARIFERGDLEEHRIIRDLKAIGIKVYLEKDGKQIEMTGEKGEQQETIVGFAGHIMGHPDGRCIGVPESPKTVHLLEMKTAKASKFKLFQKNGVKVTSEVYYGQCQNYMGELGLKRTLFIVVNKDTEEFYIERIEFDAGVFELLKEKEITVVTSENLLPKMVGLDVKMNCNWCNFKPVCKDEQQVEVNCRTCESIEIHNSGKWKCAHDPDNHFLNQDEQESACKMYEVATWLM